MEALYWRAPTQEELAPTAYTLEDFPEPEVEVWDDHWVVIDIFQKLSTQWRMGFNGPVALDYNVFHHYLERHGYTGEDFNAIMDDIGVIEQAALSEIRKSS